MISFYGGRKGNSFIISKSYDYDNRNKDIENSSYDMMINDFAKATSIVEVAYGDYVLLIHPYSDENGKVYRRVYEGEPEYIGQFMGPKGDSDFCKIFAKFGVDDTLDNSKTPEDYAREKGLSNPEQYIGWMVLKEVQEIIDEQTITFLKLYSYDYYHSAWAITDIRPGMTTKENGEIFNDYVWSKANKFAHAEGYSTKASGIYSHAEGRNTIASGTRSHAEGFRTEAKGDESHAEGYGTEAKADASHAEGYLTYIPVGEKPLTAAHAEGQRTTAAGQGAHAEGFCDGNIKDTLPDIHDSTPIKDILEAQKSATFSFTFAQKKGSHAEGVSTLSLNEGSHAEGISTYATNIASHASGQGTYAVGEYSYAEGRNTTAFGRDSHIEGYSSNACLDGRLAYDIISSDEIVNAWENNSNFSLAYGRGSHVEGHDNLAMSDFSHIEGFNNFCIGAGYSHVEGDHNRIIGSFSHASGKENHITSHGNYSFVHGKENTINNEYCISLGYQNIVDGLSSICLGYGSRTTDEGIESIIIGYGNTVAQRNSIALGYALETRNPLQVAVGRYNKIIDDSTISFMIGSGSNNTTRTNALVVKSGVAMVPGPNDELSRIATMADLENVVVSSGGDFSNLWKEIDSLKNNISTLNNTTEIAINQLALQTNKNIEKLDTRINTLRQEMLSYFDKIIGGLAGWRSKLAANKIKVPAITL